MDVSIYSKPVVRDGIKAAHTRRQRSLRGAHGEHFAVWCVRGGRQLKVYVVRVGDDLARLGGEVIYDTNRGNYLKE